MVDFVATVVFVIAVIAFFAFGNEYLKYKRKKEDELKSAKECFKR